MAQEQLTLRKQYVRSTARLFAASPHGNVTILLALALLVVFASAGAAIDYIRLGNQRTAVAAAADTTALAAVEAALGAEKAKKSNPKSIAESAAQGIWKANVATWLSDTSAKPVIKVSKAGQAWSAEVTFKGTFKTSFMSAVGLNSMSLEGHAEASTATAAIQSFWQFHVVVDTSNSMGIGATQSDMNALVANKQIACAFACHFTGTHFYFKNTLAIAAAAGIKLRINIVNDAITAMIGQMKQMSDGVHLKARLVGIDRDANELVPMTASLDKIGTFKIELTEAIVDPNAAIATGDTDYAVAIKTLTKDVGPSGDGSSEAKAQKAVFIVTDGVHDSYGSEPNAIYTWSTHHRIGPVDPKFCQSMKDAGVTVGVLYIDYIPPTSMEYVVKSTQPSILPNLKACASEGLFFNATSADGIKKAMQDMFVMTMSGSIPRLTR